ncbi:MAG: hypothetical protein C3F02_00045 [Parcubacteria group bacterium]|nr:MAG: hypothetical protein C3F02_00045 [Parcubacteria group bacterium]
MEKHALQESWEKYRAAELKNISPLLEQLNFSLETEQVHISGERYLSGGRKLVLIGRHRADQKKVVIKVSSDDQGRREIVRERDCRKILKKINFAYRVFFSPEEIFFLEKPPYTVLITAFVDQPHPFLHRPLLDQFFLALKALEAQEGAHAATYEHAHLIRGVFSRWNAQKYLENIDLCIPEILLQEKNDNLKNALDQAVMFLQKNSATIDLYSDFLVHWDLVPHNIRVHHNDIYLLDHSSLRFGNKYESWARFINFMTIYNRPLEKMLLDYVRQNRKAEEYLSLRLMRVYRLVELLRHYAQTIPKSLGNLQILNKKRLSLWTDVLISVLADRPPSDLVVENYTAERDALRSEEEKIRQKELH